MRYFYNMLKVNCANGLAVTTLLLSLMTPMLAYSASQPMTNLYLSILSQNTPIIPLFLGGL
jgi:hypothetical protein